MTLLFTNILFFRFNMVQCLDVVGRRDMAWLIVTLGHKGVSEFQRV